MEILKSKTTVILIVMILGVSYIGGMISSNLEDIKHDIQNVTVNA